MRSFIIISCVFGLILGAAGLALAADPATASQTVTFQVKGINEIAVSGDPGDLIIDTATAGQAPNPVSDSSTSYAFTTNKNNRKITGAINSSMPAGLTLEIDLAKPGLASWSTEGIKTLTTSAVDLAKGDKGYSSGNTITYTLSATADVEEMGSPDTRIVTLTLTTQ